MPSGTDNDVLGIQLLGNTLMVWGTSGGHLADWIFLLVRTNPDAPKHKGISTLLNVVGPVNSGWKGAMTLLGFERGVARPLIRASGNCWLGATAGSH
ncbi:hypothetical protein BH10ACT6_BH10ACT6_04090 [soil metagenome]